MITSVFHVVDGLTPVDPKILEIFVNEMREKTIPAIEEIIWQRELAAARCRNQPI